MRTVFIDLAQITDWKSFHLVFARELGFPGFYGRNMNAWIDCMTDLDDLDGRMTSVHVQPGEVPVLDLKEAGDFKHRCPEILEALVECAAFVNHRRMEAGQPAVLALAYDV